MRINHKKPRKNLSFSASLMCNVGGENKGVSLVNRLYSRSAIRVLENCRFTCDPFYLLLVLYHFVAHFINVQCSVYYVRVLGASFRCSLFQIIFCIVVFGLQTNNSVFLLKNSRLLLCYLFRWANQGLDFLTVACDPKTLTTLTESEFQVIIFFSVFIVYFLAGEGCVWGGSSIVRGLPCMFVTCLYPSSVIYSR